MAGGYIQFVFTAREAKEVENTLDSSAKKIFESKRNQNRQGKKTARTCMLGISILNAWIVLKWI